MYRTGAVSRGWRHPQRMTAAWIFSTKKCFKCSRVGSIFMPLFVFMNLQVIVKLESIQSCTQGPVAVTTGLDMAWLTALVIIWYLTWLSCCHWSSISKASAAPDWNLTPSGFVRAYTVCVCVCRYVTCQWWNGLVVASHMKTVFFSTFPLKTVLSRVCVCVSKCPISWNTGKTSFFIVINTSLCWDTFVCNTCFTGYPQCCPTPPPAPDSPHQQTRHNGMWWIDVKFPHAHKSQNSSQLKVLEHICDHGCMWTDSFSHVCAIKKKTVLWLRR